MKNNHGVSFLEVLIGLALVSMSFFAMAQVAEMGNKLDSLTRFRTDVDDYTKIISNLILDDSFCTKNLAGAAIETAKLNDIKDFTFSLKNINPDDTLGEVIFEKDKIISSTSSISDVKYFFEIANGDGKFIGKIEITYLSTRAVLGPNSLKRSVSFYVQMNTATNLLSNCGSSVLTGAASGSTSGLKVYKSDGVTELGLYLGLTPSNGVVFLNHKGTISHVTINLPINEYFTTSDCTGTDVYTDSFWNGATTYSLRLKSFVKPAPGGILVDTFIKSLAQINFDGTTKCVVIPPKNIKTPASFWAFELDLNSNPCGNKPCIIK